MMNEEFVEATSPIRRPLPAAWHRAAAGHRRRGAELALPRCRSSGCGGSRSAPTSRARRSPARGWTVLGGGGATGRRRGHPHRRARRTRSGCRAQLRQHHRPPVRGDPRAGAPDLLRRPGTLPRPEDPGGARRRLPAGLPRAVDHGWRARRGHPRGRARAARRLPAPVLLRHDGVRARTGAAPGRAGTAPTTCCSAPITPTTWATRTRSRWSARPGLDQAQIDLIAGGNAARLLGLT